MQPAECLRRLEELDVDTAAPADITFALQHLRELRGWFSAKEGAVARRSAVLHEQGDGFPAQDAIQTGARSSQREAARIARRAETLGDAPAMERLLAKGRVSPEHVDALATAVGRLDDDDKSELLALDHELAGAAALKSPEQFRRYLGRVADQLAADGGVERSERQRTAARLTMGIHDDTGMGWINASLHPDDFQKIRRKLDAEVGVLRRLPEFAGKQSDQLAAIAYVNLMEGRRAKAQPPAEVIVLIDHQTLIDGVHRDSIVEYSDGTPLPVATARRHACNATIIPAVLDSEGMPLDVGRGSRLATPSQRRALRSMYRTCAVGGCHRDFDHCEIHHLDEWESGGPTDLANLLPLCNHHHHRSHEGRWRLQLDPSTRELDVWLPDGTLHSRSLPDHVAERHAA